MVNDMPPKIPIPTIPTKTRTCHQGSESAVEHGKKVELGHERGDATEVDKGHGGNNAHAVVTANAHGKAATETGFSGKNGGDEHEGPGGEENVKEDEKGGGLLKAKEKKTENNKF